MTLTALISFIIYSFVTSVTPGPNNIMLISSGVSFGFKRTIPHILGIGFGFGLMVTLVGFGIGSILTNSKNLYEFVKIIGIVYLLYLAYQIYISDSVNTNNKPKSHKPLNFLQASLFQWVNPKAWVMTMGAVTAYTSSSSNISIFLLIGLIYGAISIPSVGVWALVGDKLKALINDRKKIRIFNISMALLLLISIISPLVETLSFLREKI
ncbi:MAG: LysE family translocator [Acinetobacter venetianus]|uniref:LysE family translocator n=1 Tax=Acinetobacter venetianus TaxID=52133 RepID=UPI0035BE232B